MFLDEKNGPLVGFWWAAVCRKQSHAHTRQTNRAATARRRRTPFCAISIRYSAKQAGNIFVSPSGGVGGPVPVDKTWYVDDSALMQAGVAAMAAPRRMANLSTLNRAPVGQGPSGPDWLAISFGVWSGRALATGTAWAGLCLIHHHPDANEPASLFLVRSRLAVGRCHWPVA